MVVKDSPSGGGARTPGIIHFTVKENLTKRARKRALICCESIYSAVRGSHDIYSVWFRYNNKKERNSVSLSVR